MSAHPTHIGWFSGVTAYYGGRGSARREDWGSLGTLAFAGCDPKEAGSFLQSQSSQESQIGS